ncbi:hypothetical protein COCSUDRAFT_60418 [Coccomyxa subellipsoidea C-169]|uniref:Uncharacterized protein n=1 Tax=Coccomyxa subellipsoidea (strain C-169) TaxID=574566 RepID=I0YIJ8_COCSC|nr:hypothetical protein COCSUDRAFT_60418 [Coccomyxa subellipsoidea C-169]EIE18217.1 hypothetical protein COCSUDRAFT_60418 [Coccomyxa subellipsoidea C-169]|eukprot:XP_005642761.1 hypothetical protein COCSUDRAFT_60418 [Coccomyxa subellipsoidea C-169]
MELTRYEQASDYTDSDDSSYASSCEDAESSEDPDSPCSTPRSEDLVTSLPLGPLPPEGQISPKRTVKPKIPTLGLRLDGGGAHRGPGSATPRTAVQPESARGRPSLSIPRLPTARAAEDPAAVREPPAAAALAAPVPRWSQHSSARASSLPTPQPVGLDRCDGEASYAAAVSISLMSDAFVLEQQGTIKGPQLASNALEKFSAALGVRQSELTLYEVREVKEGMQLAPRTSKLAVAVTNSGFSLGSVEKLLAENRRLKAETEADAKELESARRQCRGQQAEALSRAQIAADQAAAKEAETAQLREVCHVLKSEVTSLRDQLKRSHSLRLQGQKALDELKSEFEAITKDLAAGDAAASLSATSALTHDAGDSPVKQHSGALQPLQQQERIASILEKLCDETVLARLESCFAQAGL